MSAQYLYGIGMTGVFALSLVAAFRDYRAYIIPNWISAAIVALFFLTALGTWALGTPQIDPIPSVLISALLGLALLALFAGGHLGGGDVKLLTAVSLWAGATFIVPLLLVTTLAGGVLAIGILLLNRRSIVRAAHSGSNNSVAEVRANLPYGVAIMVGTGWLTAQIWPTAFGL